MNNLQKGSLSLLFAVPWLLFALLCEGKKSEPWIFANIPAFIVIDYLVPRIVVLIPAVLWTLGGITWILAGFNEISIIRRYATNLKSDQDVVRVFQEAMDELEWANTTYAKIADSIRHGEPYPKSIPALVKSTGETFDHVILYYQLVLDTLKVISHRIEIAASRLGIQATKLPNLDLPCVLVVEPTKRTMRDRITKVDLSSTGNTTALLCQGDLIYSYAGRLVYSRERLESLIHASDGTKTATVRVLRYVKTSHGNAFVAQGARFAWHALHFQIPAGEIDAKLEDSGTPLFIGIPNPDTQDH